MRKYTPAELKVVGKALGLQEENAELESQTLQATKHFDTMRKLQKNQSISVEERENAELNKQEFASFFDSDSDSEISGKTPEWYQSKIPEQLAYIKDEQNVNRKRFEKLVEKTPESGVFNVLTNKVTQKRSINLIPAAVKQYKEWIGEISTNPEGQNSLDSVQAGPSVLPNKLQKQESTLQSEAPIIPHPLLSQVDNSSGKGKERELSPDTFVGKGKERELSVDTSIDKGKGKETLPGTPSDFVDSLPVDYNPFDDIGSD